MRAVIVIALSLLIQMGLFGRVVSDGSCCPVSSLEHCHDHDHGNEHPHGDCHDGDVSSGDKDCPPDCGEHHHHHGSCVHTLQLSIHADSDHRLAPLRAVSLKCDLEHLRAPDGPVMEMDKPPLI